MSNVNPGQGSGEGLRDAQRKPWQRPALRQLAAKEARHGDKPGNDGGGGGGNNPGNPGNHS
jgi:hypothetical protein